MFSVFKSHNHLRLAQQQLQEAQLQRLDQAKAMAYHKAMEQMLSERISDLSNYIKVNSEISSKQSEGVDK